MKKYISLLLALVILITAIPLSGIASFAFLRGDGTGDGAITSADARLALQVAAGLVKVNSEVEAALDMDLNGKVTSIDARRILQKVAGIVDEDTDNVDQEDMRGILAMFGYLYDEEQDIYYTKHDAWQRYFGFNDIYDQAAPITNMNYMTLKIDFEYKDMNTGEPLSWRLQWWKGQYGVLEGAELGVYTRRVNAPDGAFYKCAEDQNMLQMYMEYYETIDDYNNDNMLFYREQTHWWLTGFKFGICNPKRIVVKAILIAHDKEMAEGIEEGLKNVTDKEGNWNGFVKYRPWLPQDNRNVYTVEKIRGTDQYRIEVIWYDAGYTNYGIPENPQGPDEPTTDPSEPSTDPVVPEEPSTEIPTV